MMMMKASSLARFFAQNSFLPANEIVFTIYYDYRFHFTSANEIVFTNDCRFHFTGYLVTSNFALTAALRDGGQRFPELEETEHLFPVGCAWG